MAIDRQADGASVVLTPELIESLRAQARQGKLTDADFAAVINGLTGGSQNPTSAPAGGMTPELQEKIRLLQELRLQGVLDDGSYFAAKQKLMSGDVSAPAQTTLPRMDGAKVVTNTAPAPVTNNAPDLTGLPRVDGARSVTNPAPATNNASAPDISGLPRMDGAATVKTIPARPVPPPDLLGLPRMPGGRDVTDVPAPPQPKPQPAVSRPAAQSAPRGGAYPQKPAAAPAPQPVKAAPPRQADVGFRLPIQDVFSIAGRGTVVVGTVAQGVIRIGDRADILFNDGRVIPTTVTAIEMFRKILEQAGVGDNVGVLLSGVKKSDVKGASVLVKHTAR